MEDLPNRNLQSNVIKSTGANMSSFLTNSPPNIGECGDLWPNWERKENPGRNSLF